eukprot:4037793-Amphidinium_carterae.1
MRPNRALEQQVAIPYEAHRRPRLSPRAALRAPFAAGQQQNVAAQEGTIQPGEKAESSQSL